MQHDDINHCTAENVQEKKAKDAVQSATGKQAKVCFTKKTCQTCDPLTEIHHFDQKCHVLSKHVFFFCLTWLTDIRHFEKETPLSSFQELMDYASLKVKKQKNNNKTNKSVCLSCHTGHHTREHHSQSWRSGLARRWLRTTGFTSVQLNSIQFLAAEFKPQLFSILESC